jgi:hypothetical protein
MPVQWMLPRFAAGAPGTRGYDGSRPVPDEAPLLEELAADDTAAEPAED